MLYFCYSKPAIGAQHARTVHYHSPDPESASCTDYVDHRAHPKLVRLSEYRSMHCAARRHGLSLGQPDARRRKGRRRHRRNACLASICQSNGGINETLFQLSRQRHEDRAGLLSRCSLRCLGGNSRPRAFSDDRALWGMWLSLLPISETC